MKESKITEFKESVTSTFLKTVSAYANYGTGTVLFGVADDGTEVGIADAKAQCLSIECRRFTVLLSGPVRSLLPESSIKAPKVSPRPGQTVTR